MRNGGVNTYGQLGLGDTTIRYAYVQVGTDTDWSTVSAGGSQSFAIKNDGRLFAWGRNNFSNELGLGDSINRYIPTQVGTDTNWAKVATGGDYTLALKTNGQLWAWGSNDAGQLGLGDTVPRSVPTRIGTASNWVKIAARGGRSFAITTTAALYGWWAGAYGALGSGSAANRLTPMLSADQCNTAATGDEHTLITKSNGTLYAAGRSNYGQLGLGNTTTQYGFQQVASPSVWNWEAVFAGGGSSFAVKTDKTLWGWGLNDERQLGLAAYIT